LIISISHSFCAFSVGLSSLRFFFLSLDVWFGPWHPLCGDRQWEWVHQVWVCREREAGLRVSYRDSGSG